MTDYAKAIKIVTERIKSDKELRISYIANIAMAFKDEFHRNKKKYKNSTDIHIIANNAAENFIDLWCK